MDIIYFPFFHRKFADGVRGESPSYIGTYIMLMCRQAEKGRITETPEKLARWIGGECTPEMVKQVLAERFTKDESGTFNQVLENVLEEVMEKSYSASQKALKRWSTDGKQNATAMPQHKPSNAPAMPQHSTSNAMEIEIEIRNRKGKREREKEKSPHPPTLPELINFFKENGFTEQLAKKAFQYYQSADWHDKAGKPVKNWQQTMIGVWFNETPHPIPKTNGATKKSTAGKNIEGWAGVATAGSSQ